MMLRNRNSEGPFDTYRCAIGRDINPLMATSIMVSDTWE